MTARSYIHICIQKCNRWTQEIISTKEAYSAFNLVFDVFDKMLRLLYLCRKNASITKRFLSMKTRAFAVIQHDETGQTGVIILNFTGEDMKINSRAIEQLFEGCLKRRCQRPSAALNGGSSC